MILSLEEAPLHELSSHHFHNRNSIHVDDFIVSYLHLARECFQQLPERRTFVILYGTARRRDDGESHTQRVLINRES